MAAALGSGGCDVEVIPPAVPPPEPFVSPTEGGGTGALSISTRELGSWHRTVTELESDLDSEGRVVHVIVARADGSRLPCDGYTLSIDPDAAPAFGIGLCESGATPLRLLHRPLLFAHDGELSTPLDVRLTAREERATTVSSGPAHSAVGVSCGIALRPYVTNVETGTRTLALPDRYTLHVRPQSGDGEVVVEPVTDGWQVRGGSAIAVDYDVIDNQTGATLLHDHARLSCEEGPLVSASKGADEAWDALPAAGLPCRNRQLAALLVERRRAGGHDDADELFAYTRSCEPAASSKVARATPRQVDPGTHVLANVFGWTMIAGSVAALVGGIASFTSDSLNGSHVGRGIVLVNVAPHALVVGIMTIAMSDSSYKAAEASAETVSWEPFAAPVLTGGAVVGVGRAF